QARDAIAQLSSLLRGALAGSSAQATLRDELAWLERYLDLQRLRFEDRLDVDLDIHPDTVDARVPSFLLQPLVENAFKHGVARVSRQGHVTICAQRDGDRLVLDVLDNGPGLANVGGDGSGGAAPSIGLGVTTTRDRLGRLYGDAATLDLTDRADGVGVRARVVIPFQTVAPPVHV
ncbi:MAG: histidine kinase, partial [Bacteroidota bacterium]